MTIVLDNIRSAWNVGAVLRTCDAFDANLVLVGYTPKPVGDTLALVKKTAIGAEKNVHWEHFEHWREVLQAYPNKIHLGIEISDTSQDLFTFLRGSAAKKDVDLNDTFLWFGNEISGLSKDLTESLLAELHLPMMGGKESVNVSSCVCAVGYLFRYSL